MMFDPPLLVTHDLPGIGGKIKTLPEDFEVEEIPAYLPSGQGDYLYLWIEKRGLGAEYFVRELARRLGIATGEVGTAGLKDRHAVTRQWVSLPSFVEDRLGTLDLPDLKILQVSRHTNKLKPGHLHGNRFNILVRDVPTEATIHLAPLVACIKQHGMANYYGAQRFGRGGETLDLGLRLLRRQATPEYKRINPFLKKLALSAAQSALFNLYLNRRLADGLMTKVLPGDVMAKRPFGGMFVVEDVAAEQIRFDAREIVHAGPIFGRKTFRAAAEAAAREALVLRDADLPPTAFEGFGKLVQGTRRHNLVYVDDLIADTENDGIRFRFGLPAGSYATVLLNEFMKVNFLDSDQETV